MDFLTLHEMSIKLNVSVRVLRHRLRQLLLSGRFVENRDCRRDDFVDDTHFVWRIDPVMFARATGLRPVGDQTPSAATQPAIQLATPGNEPDTRAEETLVKVDTRLPVIEREMVDLLKNQVRVKDTQIADLSAQNKALNNLHLKLTGQIVQQSDRIQTLLQLTGGKLDLAEVVNRADSKSVATDSQTDNTRLGTDNPIGNQRNSSTRGQGIERAA
jgi:hypothetical protein